MPPRPLRPPRLRRRLLRVQRRMARVARMVRMRRVKVAIAGPARWCRPRRRLLLCHHPAVRGALPRRRGPPEPSATQAIAAATWRIAVAAQAAAAAAAAGRRLSELTTSTSSLRAQMAPGFARLAIRPFQLPSDELRHQQRFRQHNRRHHERYRRHHRLGQCLLFRRSLRQRHRSSIPHSWKATSEVMRKDVAHLSSDELAQTHVSSSSFLPPFPVPFLRFGFSGLFCVTVLWRSPLLLADVSDHRSERRRIEVVGAASALSPLRVK